MNIRNCIEAYIPSCEQEALERELILSAMDINDKIFLRSSALAHFTASGWIVNPSRTRVLMVYHNIYDSWSWTGGHADGDADLLAVAVREACEETGLVRVSPVSADIFSLEILNVNAHVKRGKYVNPHLHLNLTYLLEADEADVLRSKPDENSGVRWFGLDEAIEASTEPEMRVIYRKLNDKLRTLH